MPADRSTSTTWHSSSCACAIPEALPARYNLVLQLSDAAAEKIRVFDLSAVIPKSIIVPGVPRATIPYARGVRPLRAEALQYRDVGFSGLITLHLVLTEDGEPIGAASVVFRVAPWIMPSSLQRPRRWIQDELEIGYSQVPGKTLGVVLDSPRNRGLDPYPERLIAPGFGWVTRGDDGSVVSSLDSFGNLEVSPPVEVRGRDSATTRSAPPTPSISASSTGSAASSSIGLACEFVDTWYSYHILSGEIHCGTNAYREPIPTPWWETTPPGAFDV